MTTKNTVNRIFFAHYYFSRFSPAPFELHSRKIQDRENFNVDYFYRFRPFFMSFVCFWVFAVFCRHCFSPIREKYMLAKMLVAHSRTIDAREIYTFYSKYSFNADLDCFIFFQENGYFFVCIKLCQHAKQYVSLPELVAFPALLINVISSFIDRFS